MREIAALSSSHWSGMSAMPMAFCFPVSRVAGDSMGTAWGSVVAHSPAFPTALLNPELRNIFPTCASSVFLTVTICCTRTTSRPTRDWEKKNPKEKPLQIKLPLISPVIIPDPTVHGSSAPNENTSYLPRVGYS